MIKVSLTEMKARLPYYMKKVERGQVIVVARHNQPIAQIQPLHGRVTRRRPAGLCRGEFQVPEGFNAPLPQDILEAFEGV